MRVDFTEIYSKVRLYLSVGRYEAAEKLLSNALDEHGSLANIHNLLGVTFHRQSKFADAVVQFTKALKINPSFVEAGLNLAATFCDLGKYDDAKAVFTEVLASTPTNRKQPDLILGRLANQHAECGRLYEQSGLITEAMMEYKRALSLYEKMPDVRLSLGKLLFKTGQVDKALKEFQIVGSQFPDEHEAQLWSGISNWKLGNVDLAHRQWQTAVSLQGGSGVSSSYLRISQELKKTLVKATTSSSENSR